MYVYVNAEIESRNTLAVLISWGFLGAPCQGPSIYEHDVSLLSPLVPCLYHFVQRAPAEGKPKTQLHVAHCRLGSFLIGLNSEFIPS